jgi:phage N-6-adenine-methyltransferase
VELTIVQESYLTADEQRDLTHHEGRIEIALDQMLAAGVIVGVNLREINRKRLYRAYGTFEQYVAERWQKGRQWAYQLIGAAQVLDNIALDVSHGVQIPTERQLRPLTALPAAAQPIAWQEASNRSDGNPTARVVEAVVREMRGETPENDTLDPPMELEQVADQFPDELTATDREILQSEEDEALDSNEWYTPVEFIEAARTVMGGIDTDPASNDTAQAFIQAGAYYTKETNGLAQPWGARVWLNPPYAEPLPWIEKLLAEFEAGRTKQAILLVNTANSPQWSRLLWHSMFAVCLLDRRVRFWRPDRAEAKGTAQDQMLWYIGYETDAFRYVFDSFGAIR